MSENWVSIYSAVQMYEAELIKSILAEKNIECVIMNKQDSTYGIGDIEIYVLNANAFNAKQLILEFKGE